MLHDHSCTSCSRASARWWGHKYLVFFLPLHPSNFAKVLDMCMATPKLPSVNGHVFFLSDAVSKPHLSPNMWGRPHSRRVTSNLFVLASWAAIMPLFDLVCEIAIGCFDASQSFWWIKNSYELLCVFCNHLNPAATPACRFFPLPCKTETSWLMNCEHHPTPMEISFWDPNLGAHI